MKTRLSILRILLLVAPVLLLAAMAGGPAFWQRYLAALGAGNPQLTAEHVRPVTAVAGGGGIAPPRADAVAQNIAPEAIEAIQKLAQQQGARVVILHRHGHRVAEHYGEGESAATRVAGGTLSPLPWLLAFEVQAGHADAAARVPSDFTAGLRISGDASWRNPWSGSATAHFGSEAPAAELALPDALRTTSLLSSQLWSRIGASDAAVQVAADGHPRLSCCFVAAADDWMRLADLLVQRGEYAGERVVAAPAVQRLPWLKLSASTTGDEPPATRDAVAIDLERGARLWLSPQRGIALLYLERSGSGLATDTELVNLVFRGIIDQQGSTADTTHAADIHGP